VWIVPSGWGVADQGVQKNEQIVRWEALVGELPVQSMRYVLPNRARLRTVSLEWAGHVGIARFEQKGASVEIELSQTLTVTEGQPLVVHLEID
jgi:hypothetical protein